MPRKFHLGTKQAPAPESASTSTSVGVPQSRKIRCDFVTVQKQTGEGQFATFTSLVFQGDAYEEVPGSIVYLPTEFGYPPPGAVKVSAVVTEEVFGVIDNYQSGSDAEGELAQMAIYEGSAYWEDTGEPVNTMEAFRTQQAEELAAQTEQGGEDGSG